MFNKHKLEFFLIKFFGSIFTVFGNESIIPSSKFLAFVAYRFLGIRKNIVHKNLSIAFPNLNKSQIKKLAFQNYQSIAITFLELFLIPKTDRQGIINMVSDNDVDYIKKKFSEGKGLILLTAHFGNWELGAISVGIYLNHPLKVLVKKQKNVYVANWITKIREKFGNSEITLGVSIRELFKAIKSNDIIGIVGDQRATKDGVNVKFFDRETLTFPGTAAIALKTNCNVIVIFCIRGDNQRYKSVIEEIDLNTLVGSQDERIKAFNQKYMSILENNVKKYPEQWFWMHNIWKHQ